MSYSTRRLFVSMLAATGFSIGLGVSAPAFSQTPATDGRAVTSGPANTDPATARAQEKAARKADWKAHREQTNAELKVLEANGYNPAFDQRHYPANLEAAQQRAAANAANAAAGK